MDAASNRGIDDVRELREKIAFAPSDLMKKVYLLDEVHMLTDGAFNALLKTLEEPPPHAVFILATTELQKVPDTIKSRCQRYDFHRIPNDALVGRLRFICEQEGFKVTDEGLLIISVQSRGGARDAINLLEQVISRYGTTPTTAEVIAGLGLVRDERSEQLVQALLDEDLATALDLTRAVADDGIDLTRFAKATVDILREMLPQVLRRAVNPELGYTALVQKAIDRGPGGIPTLVSAIQELAKADFRLDPGNPVPLEVACASVILGPVAAPAAAAPAGRPQEAGGPPRAQSRPGASPARAAAWPTCGLAPG
jgi:DNA polymerase-3 subunit gamma/tau